MILTLTANPTLDRTLEFTTFAVGDVLRPIGTMVTAGGKGINTARTIHTLGGETLCTGFLGGSSGQTVADMVRADGIDSDWTWVDGSTRLCTILVDASIEQTTVINESGPDISNSDWQRLRNSVIKHTDSQTTVCVCGSLPPGASLGNFRSLIDEIKAFAPRVWIDTSGAALDATLAMADICIKVNTDEAGAVLNRHIKGPMAAADAADELRKTNKPLVVLTMGADGAVIATDAGRWYAKPPVVTVKSPLGSGDAFLGGLALGLSQGKSADEALRMGSAAGAANAMNYGGGRFDLPTYEQLLSQIHVKAL